MNDLKLTKWKNKNVLTILSYWIRTFSNNNVGKLMKALEDAGANTALYCGPHRKDIYINEIVYFKESFPNAKLYCLTNNSNLFKTGRNIFKTLRNFKPDIIIWTYAGYRENLFLAVNRLLGGSPYLIKTDSHMPESQHFISIWNKISRFSFYNLPVKLSNLVIVETEEIKNKTREFYKSDRLYLLPNGVPLKMFKDMDKLISKQSPHVRVPYILYTGRVSYEKGIDMLIESFAKISAKIPEWCLYVVGPVWDLDYKKKCQEIIINRRLENRVIFQPCVFGEELYRWYYFSDIYVLPSREEGLANRIPEAMFFGNPIVAFDVGQTNSMVTKETGIIIEQEDIDKFAEAILLLARDKDRRNKMGQRAKYIIESNYDDDILISGLLKKCEEFL